MVVNFQDLKSLPECGIYAFVNASERKVCIFHSKSLIEGLARNIRDIKQRIHPLKGLITDQDKLEIEILETVINDEFLLLRRSYWFKKYKEEGWKLYNNRNPLTYRVTTKIRYDRLFVELESKRHNTIVVGVFNKVEDGDKFIKNFYPNTKDVTEIIFANNPWTRKYYKELENER